MNLQLFMRIMVFAFLHPYQHYLAIMGINGAATDILFSNPMVKHLQSNYKIRTAQHLFNQLMMIQMLSKNGKTLICETT